MMRLESLRRDMMLPLPCRGENVPERTPDEQISKIYEEYTELRDALETYETYVNGYEVRERSEYEEEKLFAAVREEGVDVIITVCTLFDMLGITDADIAAAMIAKNMHNMERGYIRGEGPK